MEYAAANHRPTGLVVVGVSGIDDRNIEIPFPFQQACGSGRPGRSTTYDDDIVGCDGPVG
jgi:hypothetical protein